MVLNELSSKAYYKNEYGIILNMDCVEAMKLMPDGCIDLTVTSPPYDNLRTYEGFSWDFESTAKELYRITKQGGVVVWVVGDATVNGSETGTSFKQALYFKEIGFNLHDTMIFQKINPIPQIFRKRYNNEFEYMFILTKGLIKTCNPIKIDCIHAGLKLNGTTYKNFSTSEQKRNKLANPVNKQKIKGNIWSYVVGKKKEDQEAKEHPAPFPCQLANDHIISWSNENDIIFDPFMGSGTTAKMAMLNNRKFIGCEISEKYCKIIKERLENVERI